MFGKLKEKLKNWAKKLSDEIPSEEKEVIEEIKKDKKAKKKEKSKKETKKRETKVGVSVEENIDSNEDKEILKEEIETPKSEIKEDKKKSILSFFKKHSEKRIQETPASTDEVIDKKEDKEILKEELESKENFFQKIASKVQKVKISQEDFNTYSEELEMLLLENNVAYEVTEKIINELKEKILGREILKKELQSEIFESLKDSIYGALIEPFSIKDRINSKQEKPYVILFCGINGTGKTTTIAKIAQSLKKEGITSVLAASDTFRSAAIEQIKIHGEKIGIKVISNEYQSDPASVGYDAIQYAKKHDIKAVLIDTAGRMHTDKNLLKEIEKISRVCNPDIKIFVGESITGNDSIEQVRAFNQAIGIDGIILTKADIDEKGGTALSLGYITKKPILYLGIGQEYDKIEKFDKEKFVKNLGLE